EDRRRMRGEESARLFRIRPAGPFTVKLVQRRLETLPAGDFGDDVAREAHHQRRGRVQAGEQMDEGGALFRGEHDAKAPWSPLDEWKKGDAVPRADAVNRLTA